MRVIKRRNFVYLQHSFRKSGATLTKERYLGKDMSGNMSKNALKDIEKKKKELFEECRKEAFYNNFEVIKQKFREEWNSFPESAKQKMIEEFSVNFTYNTNAIEGSKITEEDTRGIVIHNFAPSKNLRDIKETEKHAALFQRIMGEKTVLSKKIILEWHRELFSETKPDVAGAFREHLVRVGSYTAPDWQEVQRLMNELFQFIKEIENKAEEKEKMHPVELAARVHYRFEKIHPFSDGNGRIGRLLMNAIIWNNNYPILVIEYKKRKSYYKAFQKDEEYFVQYLLRRYFAVHKRYLKR